MDKLWYLQGLDFFNGLEREKALFLNKAKRKYLEKNDIIFFEGDPGESCFYLESGLTRIFSIHESGKETIFFLRRAGEIFGLSEMLEMQPRKANAQALAPSVVHILGREDFENLLRTNFALARRVIALLGARVRHLGETIANLVACDVESRVAKLLIALVYECLSDEASWRQEASLPMRITQTQLAQLAGTSQPTISEILGKFQSQGLLRVGRKRLTILKPLELLESADSTSPS